MYRKITIKVPTSVVEYLETKAREHNMGLQKLAGLTLVEGLALIHEKIKENKEEENVHSEDQNRD